MNLHELGQSYLVLVSVLHERTLKMLTGTQLSKRVMNRVSDRGRDSLIESGRHKQTDRETETKWQTE